MSVSKKKWTVVALLTAIPAAAFTFAVARPGTPFREGEVVRGEIVSVINSTGTVRPVKSIPIPSPTMGGTVTKVNVKHDDPVKKGQVLAEIDTKPGADRTRVIAPADGIIMDKQVEEGQTLTGREAAPIFTVAENLNTEVHVYASIDEADIGEIHKAHLSKQPVVFTVEAYPLDEFKGTIQDIRKNPTVQQSVVTYFVVVSALNKDGKLFPGMTAKLSFQIDKRENVLKIPSAALRFFPKARFVHPDDRHILEGTQEETVKTESTDTTKDDRSATQRVQDRQRESRRHVWMLEKDYLRAVEVTTGLNDNAYSELVSGDLRPGQKLIIGAR
jgi:HlyD family secretion protein